jgi:phosphatidylserine/phosphatidylglycerophosphate/cardiolipin synthase-like enzyme
MFIVDLSPARDAEVKIIGVLRELQAASWRGVDARLLIGGSRSNFEIAEASATARDVASSFGIPCRWLTARDVRGSHMKLVVVDDCVVIGSHNWSGGAFSRQTQDSVLLESRAMAGWLATVFEDQWQRAGA